MGGVGGWMSPHSGRTGDTPPFGVTPGAGETNRTSCLSVGSAGRITATASTARSGGTATTSSTGSTGSTTYRDASEWIVGTTTER